jgi:hypothetical protein
MAEGPNFGKRPRFCDLGVVRDWARRERLEGKALVDPDGENSSPRGAAFNVRLLGTAPPRAYQQIALKAGQLNRLELNYATIARRLGVTAETVAKAIAWDDRRSRSRGIHDRRTLAIREPILAFSQPVRSPGPYGAVQSRSIRKRCDHSGHLLNSAMAYLAA